jgi:trigger factor
MQVSVEKTSELSRKMTVSIPEEVITEKMDARVKSLAREVKLDGFRPGKVPHHVIKKRYGERLRGEISGDLIQSSYFEALQEQDLKPAGPPHIHQSDKSSGFEYTAEFEVYPEISLQTVEQMEVNRPVAAIEEADIDAMIVKLREQKKVWQEVERPVQEQDRMTINFSGAVAGENFTNGKEENFLVVIGSSQMIPGFEEQLIGLKAGENKSFEIQFPEDYGNQKLAGQTAEFEIEGIKVEAASLPEVDAEFIKEYGVDDGEMDSFRTAVKGNMDRELQQAIKGKLKTSVMDALYEKIEVNLPVTLVDQEINNLMKPYTEQAKQQNINIDEMNLPRDTFEEKAKRRVALGLILAEIIQTNGIKAEADKVRAAIEDMAKSYDNPEEIVNWYYAEENRLSEIEQMVLEDQTVAWLLEKVSVSDVATKFDELTNAAQ